MEDLLDIRGKPKIYKGIEIYPVLMENCMFFYQLIGCLLIEKNNTSDISIIKMTYLDFLFKLFEEENTKELFFIFIELLKMILKDQEFGFKIDKKNRMNIFVCKDEELFKKYNNLLLQSKNDDELSKIIKQYEVSNKDKLYIINGRDFENIRKIILKQNRVQYNGDLISSDFKEAMKEAQDFINRKNKDSRITLEDQYLAYHCSIGMSYEKIDKLSIYQFSKGLEMKMHQVSFEALGGALLFGMDEKSEMPTWIEHLKEKGVYDEVTVSDEDYMKFTNTLSSIK